MKKVPFFSIVIPTYNRANDLRFALYCILRQSFTDFEIVVCDNNSDDTTKEVVESFHTSKIRYFYNKRNIGYKPNFKKAISHARGSYVLLHGDDDFIFQKSAFEKLHRVILKHNPGFIRVNYLCQTSDKKTLFDFVPNRVFQKNEYIKPRSKNSDVVNFILNTDAHFLTGILFKNVLPKSITIVDTEPCSWIEILLYATKKFGAYFMYERQIIASWSQWRPDEKGVHMLFDTVGGKLQSEVFLKTVKKFLTPKEYDLFLYDQMRRLYVCMFPAIKFFTGSANLVRVAKRVRTLHPQIATSFVYKLYLLLGLITPRFVLGYIRHYFFLKFTSLYKVSSMNEISLEVNRLSKDYQKYILMHSLQR